MLEVARHCAEGALLREELSATTVEADNHIRSHNIADVVEHRDDRLRFRVSLSRIVHVHEGDVDLHQCPAKQSPSYRPRSQESP